MYFVQRTAVLWWKVCDEKKGTGTHREYSYSDKKIGIIVNFVSLKMKGVDYRGIIGKT